MFKNNYTKNNINIYLLGIKNIITYTKFISNILIFDFHNILLYFSKIFHKDKLFL